MKRPSAGILLFRMSNGQTEALLGHPGGPFWAKKDAGAWSIPKGEFENDEDPTLAAEREFREETGQQVPAGERISLGTVKRADGKVIHAWAVQGEIDLTHFVSNTFEMEWPPKSGRIQTFPEIDRIAWVALDRAPAKMHAGQAAFIVRLAEHLGVALKPPSPDQPRLF